MMAAIRNICIIYFLTAGKKFGEELSDEKKHKNILSYLIKTFIIFLSSVNRERKRAITMKKI